MIELNKLLTNAESVWCRISTLSIVCFSIYIAVCRFTAISVTIVGTRCRTGIACTSASCRIENTHAHSIIIIYLSNISLFAYIIMSWVWRCPFIAASNIPRRHADWARFSIWSFDPQYPFLPNNIDCYFVWQPLRKMEQPLRNLSGNVPGCNVFNSNFLFLYLSHVVLR